MNKETRICSCGAIYELVEHSIMMRDTDSEECDICGKELIHWNGGCIWTKKLLNPEKFGNKQNGSLGIHNL